MGQTVEYVTGYLAWVRSGAEPPQSCPPEGEIEKAATPVGNRGSPIASFAPNLALIGLKVKLHVFFDDDNHVGRLATGTQQPLSIANETGTGALDEHINIEIREVAE